MTKYVCVHLGTQRGGQFNLKKYSRLATAGVAITIMGILVGCGSSGGGTVPTKNTTNTETANTTSNNTGTTNTQNNTPLGNASVGTSNSTTSTGKTGSSNSSQVYVFSQSMLKVMYTVEYFRSVGPIIPPANIQKEVDTWAPKVSESMLAYAPESEQTLDKELIENIQGALKTPPTDELISNLPGYTLHHDQLPTGQRIYWYPSDNKFPAWVNPILK